MKKTISYISTLVLFATLISACGEKKEPSSDTSSSKGEYEATLDYNMFVDPPNRFRSYPFYSINDKLTPEELTRQIKEFKAAGFGGFYLHSRVGLLTEYLGEEWWQAMDAAVQAAKEADVEVWFYDEDKWPSGYAGGKIPNMGEEYRAKSLVRLDKKTPLPHGIKILKEDSQYRYVEHTAQMGMAIFNGTCWVDLMNPEVVKAFLNSTHKEYFDRYEEQIPYTFGIFSDEPHIHARYFDEDTHHKGIKSYSPYVRDRFMKKFGYDMFSKVDLLFEEKEDWRKVRLQFHQSVAEQFALSFTKQVADYCESKNSRFTGHYLGEDVQRKVRDRIGNSMLHYRYMQQPGMDHLGLTVDKRLITARSVSSVANQYEIPRRLSELFGISGQNMNFEDRKWIANWHAINGINHFCPHLTLYSMKGERKRDYPPTFSYHQPYWKHNKEVEDYLGRISYATTVGQYQPQVLVVSPLESEYIRGDKEPQFTAGLLDALQQLQEAHYDYDLGDEQIIADTAVVNNATITVGAMSYKMVLLPDMTGMRETTLNLLIKFASEGGKIVHYGDRFPEYIDGVLGSDKLAMLKRIARPATTATFAQTLHQMLEPNVTISGADNSLIWSHVRAAEGGNLVQLTNTSHLNKVRFKISSLLLKDNPVLWNPETAECYTLQPAEDGSYLLELASSSSCWITSGELSKNAKLVGVYKLSKSYRAIKKLADEWQAKRLNPNAITLDFARYSTDNGANWSELEPVIGIQERLTKQNYKGPLNLKYEATVKAIPSNTSLVVEQPEIYQQIKVNGREVTFTSRDFYVDRSFIVQPISSLIGEGNNKIELAVNYKAPQPLSADQHERVGTEIESIYLIGDFAVTSKKHRTDNNSQRNRTGFMPKRPVYIFTDFTIGKEQKEVDGNLTLEGYPFYSGSFELSQILKIKTKEDSVRYALHLPAHEAIVTVIELNGKKYKPLTSAPYIVDVTDALQEGDNDLKITFTNSLRNLMGPHHHVWGEMTRVGPKTFSGVGGFPNGRGNSDWYDLRLTDKPLNSWRDHYYNIPFGLLKPVELCISEE